MSTTDQDGPYTKVGDLGTVYDVPLYDDDLELVNLDPSAASVMQLIFRMPGAAGLAVRDADPVQVSIGGVDVWCLRYIVTAADVAPYQDASTGGFHQSDGLVSIEAHLEFGSNQKWTSSTVTRDQQGRPRRIVARLSA
jgi:hypothetical protein